MISIFVNLCQICIRRGKARTPDHGNKLEHVSLQGIKRMLMGKKGPSRARASGWVGGRNGMSMASLQGLLEEQAEAVLDEMSVKMDEHLQGRRRRSRPPSTRPSTPSSARWSAPWAATPRS